MVVDEVLVPFDKANGNAQFDRGFVALLVNDGKGVKLQVYLVILVDHILEVVDVKLG